MPRFLKKLPSSQSLREGHPGRQGPCGLLGIHRSWWQVTHTPTHPTVSCIILHSSSLAFESTQRKYMCEFTPTCVYQERAPGSARHPQMAGDCAGRSPIQVGRPPGGQVYLHIICMCRHSPSHLCREHFQAKLLLLLLQCSRCSPTHCQRVLRRETGQELAELSRDSCQSRWALDSPWTTSNNPHPWADPSELPTHKALI